MNGVTLHVEGTDDFHVIIHLLQAHEIKTTEDPFGEGVHLDPKVKDPKASRNSGVKNLLKKMAPTIRTANGRTQAFVMDADTSETEGGVVSRWNAVRKLLESAGVMEDPRDDPGYIGFSEEYQARVGVWIMPDNESDGTLESFLTTLVDQQDSLFELASKSTDDARHIAKFQAKDLEKAKLYCWLAWQEDPGEPFGLAIHKRYFRHDSPEALAFVNWVRSLLETP